jgi:hypothetical protein
VFAFADVVHFLPDEFTRLSGRRLPFPCIFLRPFDGFLFRHFFYPPLPSSFISDPAFPHPRSLQKRQDTCYRVSQMVTITIKGNRIHFDVQGIDQMWAIRSQLEFPLSHIRSVRVDPEAARGWWHGLKLWGSNIPGVLTAGTFFQEGGIVFYDGYCHLNVFAARLSALTSAPCGAHQVSQPTVPLLKKR